MPVKTFWIATFGWLVVAIMTVVLFYRLILSDFGNCSSNSSNSNNSSSNSNNSSGNSNNSNKRNDDKYISKCSYTKESNCFNQSSGKNELPLKEEQKLHKENKVQKEHLLNHSIEQGEEKDEQQQHSEKAVVSKMKHQPQVNHNCNQKQNRQKEKLNTSEKQTFLTSSKSNDSTHEEERKEEDDDEDKQILQHKNTSKITTTNDDSLHVTNANDGSDIISNFNCVECCTYTCVKEEKRIEPNNETASNNQTLQLEQCPC